MLSRRDVSVPGTLKESTVQRSPWLLDDGDGALRRQLGARTTQLYFFGALCWKTETRVHTMPAAMPLPFTLTLTLTRIVTQVEP